MLNRGSKETEKYPMLRNPEIINYFNEKIMKVNDRKTEKKYPSSVNKITLPFVKIINR